MTEARHEREIDSVKQLQTFLEKVARENVREFCENPSELRLGLNAAWALDALASHLFEASSEIVKLDCKTDSIFKSQRAQNDKEFFLVWEVSTAAKHGVALRTKFVKSSEEIKEVKVEGWLAFFSGVQSEKWGDRLMLANEHFGLIPLDRAIWDAFEKIELECELIISGADSLAADASQRAPDRRDVQHRHGDAERDHPEAEDGQKAKDAAADQ